MALAEYAANRDRADRERVLLCLETLRVQIETFVRNRMDASALARALMRRLLTPSFASGFPQEVRRAHDAALRSTGETGAEWLPAVEGWVAAHPGAVRAIAAAAVSLKVALGALAAWALPPERGLLAFVSPIKWVYFGAGYLLGAYLVALLVSLAMRRRARFRAARLKAFDVSLEDLVRRPLLEAMEAVVPTTTLERVERLISQIERAGIERAAIGPTALERPGIGRTASERAGPLTARDPPPAPRAGGSGRSGGGRATPP
jgi:hypothetical protein